MRKSSPDGFSDVSSSLIGFSEQSSCDKPAATYETPKDSEAAAIWIAKFALEYLGDGGKACLEEKIKRSWPWIAESLPYRMG